MDEAVEAIFFGSGFVGSIALQPSVCLLGEVVEEGLIDHAAQEGLELDPGWLESKPSEAHQPDAALLALLVDGDRDVGLAGEAAEVVYDNHVEGARLRPNAAE